MYRICPKCGHEHHGPEAPGERCPACGIVFRKWLKQQCGTVPGAASGPDRTPVAEAPWAPLLTCAEDGRGAWLGRAGVWLLLVWLGWVVATTGYTEVVSGRTATGYDFLHRIDLVFHEAGHVLLRPFGSFMMVSGGSLLQMLVPAVVLNAFLRRRDNFGASVGLWWLGQSLADVAVYVRDARDLRLVLLGGGTGADRPGFHDWHQILSRLGMLDYERVLAALLSGAGVVCLGVALLWGAALLQRQRRATN